MGFNSVFKGLINSIVEADPSGKLIVAADWK